MRVLSTWLLTALSLVLWVQIVMAHESRPLYAEIKERPGGGYSVSSKVPPSVDAAFAPEIVMPESCRASGSPRGSQIARQQNYVCATDLSGESIEIRYPRFNPSVSTLFHLERLSGEKHSAVLGPKETVWRVPETESLWAVAHDYTWLGVEHILEGYDHLLFIACLIMIAGTFRRIVITVTGFTVAHSITLAAATLGLIHVPIPPVEAAIALSIVFLATELARKRRDTLTWRYPIAVSGSFGLLHGLGFASVLGDIGLPQTEIPAALLFFNIGVELGQVFFVVVVIGAIAGLRSIGVLAPAEGEGQRSAIPQGIVRPAAYMIGVIASFWMFERIAGFAG